MLEKGREWARKNAGRIVLAAAALLILLVLLSRAKSEASPAAKTQQERLDYLASLGWEAVPESEEYSTVVVPDCGESAMADYNELMRKGGFDLSGLAGKSVDRYTYELENYPDCDQTVLLTLYVWKGRVVGGDIHTAALSGFMHELRPNEQEKPGP